MKNGNKKIVISILIVIFLLLVTLGASIAFFSYLKLGEEESSVKLGTITFKYTENEDIGNGISISDAYPISDEEGKNQVATGQVFDFKIEANLSRSDIEYEIVAEPTEDTTMPLNAIKFYLTDITSGTEEEIASSLDSEGNVKTLDQFSDTEINNATGKTIYQETILKNTKDYLKQFRARMWLSDQVEWTEEYINTKASIRINVYANSDKSMTSNTVTTPTDTSIERIVVNNKYLFTEVEDNSDYQYTLTVPSEVETVDINVVTSNTEATVEVTQISRVLGLQLGENYFLATVTSSDKTRSQEYILRIVREIDTDSTLKNLEVTGYKLSPAFNSNTTDYTLTLEATSIEVIAEANSKFAEVLGAGTQTLSWGENVINITVTAQDGTIEMYKITVTNVEPTAPVITGGSDNWVTTESTISIETIGTALSGVKEYEYYKSESSEEPTEETTATGILTTDSSSLTIDEEGTAYIWYRTVSNNGLKSAWSNSQVIKIDYENPTISVTLNSTVATLTMSDSQGVIGYGVNQSETTEPEYTEITSTTSYNVDWAATTGGTYYVWVKDKAGKTAIASFTLSNSLFCSYKTGQTWSYSYTGAVSTFSTPCDATYQLEVWGGQGGSASTTYYGGYGGYSVGDVSLTKGTNLYVHVGNQGAVCSTANNAGVYNGGGKCTIISGYTSNSRFGTGGGATHIAMGDTNRGILSNYSSYQDELLIVAGGGGGGAYFASGTSDFRAGIGGSAGGYVGSTNTNKSTSTDYSCWKTVTKAATGGSQTSGGTAVNICGYTGVGESGSFGTANLTSSQSAISGGGGGYYGGASNRMIGGTGGSGYIGNEKLTNKKMYCYNCTASTAESTYTVSTTNVSSTATSNYAKTGTGYAKITLISFDE